MGCPIIPKNMLSPVIYLIKAHFIAPIISPNLPIGIDEKHPRLMGKTLKSRGHGPLQKRSKSQIDKLDNGSFRTMEDKPVRKVIAQFGSG